MVRHERSSAAKLWTAQMLAQVPQYPADSQVPFVLLRAAGLVVGTRDRAAQGFSSVTALAELYAGFGRVRP